MSHRLKVALVAMSVRGVMGQYLESLSAALSPHVDLFLVVPDHYSGVSTASQRFHVGNSRRESIQRLLSRGLAETLWTEIESSGADVMHVFNGEGYPLSIRLARHAKKAGLPYIVTVHDPKPHSRELWGFANGIARQLTLAGARGIHIHHESFRRFLPMHTAESADISVIPHGNIGSHFPQPPPGTLREEDLVLFFGRMSWYKGLDVLVEAMGMLDGRMRCIIAGPGRVPRHIRRAVDRSGGQIMLHNRYVPDADVPSLLGRAAVVAMPYREATQSSLPTLAAHFGVPVVASAVGAFIDDVPAVGGYLVPPGDAAALADAILQARRSLPLRPASLSFEHLAIQFVDAYCRASSASGRG